MCSNDSSEGVRRPPEWAALESVEREVDGRSPGETIDPQTLAAQLRLDRAVVEAKLFELAREGRGELVFQVMDGNSPVTDEQGVPLGFPRQSEIPPAIHDAFGKEIEVTPDNVRLVFIADAPADRSPANRRSVVGGAVRRFRKPLKPHRDPEYAELRERNGEIDGELHKKWDVNGFLDSCHNAFSLLFMLCCVAMAVVGILALFGQVPVDRDLFAIVFPALMTTGGGALVGRRMVALKRGDWPAAQTGGVAGAASAA